MGNNDLLARIAALEERIARIEAVFLSWNIQPWNGPPPGSLPQTTASPVPSYAGTTVTPPTKVYINGMAPLC